MILFGMLAGMLSSWITSGEDSPLFPEAPSATKLSLENTWDLNHGSLFPGKVSEQLYKQRMDSLTEFLRAKRFPYHVRKRVKTFYMHLYANKVRQRVDAAFLHVLAIAWYLCCSLLLQDSLARRSIKQCYLRDELSMS